jgi:hypothetical protein
MQLLPKMSNELGFSVRDDGVVHIMRSIYSFSYLLAFVTGMNRNEVSRLRESINNHPNGIILAGSQRQTHDEIYTDVFPLPSRSIQWL